jgi:hypothetical protein
MTYRWTNSLREPLASLGRAEPWQRVERSRDGDWLVLPNASPGDGGWFREKDGRLEPLNPLDDAELPRVGEVVRELLRSGCGVRLLAWRVHRRAVFRVDSAQETSIYKFYRKDRSLMRRWAALPSEAGQRWRTPRVLDWNPEALLLRLEDCPGRSLNDRWLAGHGPPSDAEPINEVLAWLHERPLPKGLPTHGADEEMALLDKRIAAFHQTLREPPQEVDRIASRVLNRLAIPSGSRPVLCHRDLHDKQILLDPNGGGTLIDLDLVAAGPPALDVGNILGHLRLRALKGARIRWDEIARRIAGSAIASRNIAESLPCWTASTLLRLALIYSRRRRSLGLLEDLLRSADEALDGRGQWAGILVS